MLTTNEILTKVNQAKYEINQADTERKDDALVAMAYHLLAASQEILAANQKDMINAKETISPVMLDRLLLTEERIQSMASGILELIALPDPIGKVLHQEDLDNGLHIEKKRVPLGVIAIIYESRPNVTSDAAALAIKSGNAVVLRSGKEAYNSAKAIVKSLKLGLEEVGLSSDILQLIEDTSRESAYELMKAKGQIDLLIPRGGAGLIQACVREATVPCIETGSGICHLYVDAQADLEMAVRILLNAKTSRPSVCNAVEVCLVHEAVAADFLPLVEKTLVENRMASQAIPVQLKLDSRASDFISGQAAGPQDFDQEFLDYTLAIKVVPSLDAALEHIEKHSSKHSEAIITKDKTRAEKFLNTVDSAAVFLNASTRFTDGGQFGLGCEMGISTQKLHARGPMGLEELTTYKYLIYGDGQIRE
ncbi:glutamate-5-semialdehyde dehydrogenase [Granulicatella seriolae]|uniref:Gamma-glutamyl phosphate reductase n=1 Tax=Granulicatella seriolae TaxID=2967226 RepID=A0ABT1WL57_9LACT|nr:glutamate-5-semialdehyde dehydrogenase [Granulicatella seriolae]